MTVPQDPVVFQPAPRTLTVPADDEDVLAVPRRDWDRIYRCVGAITQSPKYMFNLAWTMVGVAAASILAWIPWQAVALQLPNNVQLRYSWVGPTLVIVAIGSFVFALFSFAVATTNSRQQSRDVFDVLEDMESIHRPIRVKARPQERKDRSYVTTSDQPLRPPGSLPSLPSVGREPTTGRD